MPGPDTKLCAGNEILLTMIEKVKLVNDINSTFYSLATAISRFSHEQLNAIPFEGSWTAGQVAEHIIKCGSGIPDQTTEKTNRDPDAMVKPISDLFLNFEIKFQADPSLQPERDRHNKSEILETLKAIENTHTKTAEAADLEALCLDMELPSFGYLTRYEWVRFVLVHTQRHTRQIENIFSKMTA